MLPEDRLEEATKQIRLARESESLTQVEQQWLLDAVQAIQAAEAALEGSREQSEDAEVIE